MVGSGTNISCGRRLWLSCEDGEALVRRRSTHSSPSDIPQTSYPYRPLSGIRAMIQQVADEEQEKSARRCSRRQQTPKCRRDWLFATILLVILNCDMVWSQYTVVQVSEDVLRSSRSESSGSSASTRSDVEHISEIYNNNKINNNKEQQRTEKANAMGLSESEERRIQDLVLRGLNITRIPRSSEINISQQEYEEKYRLYLERLNLARNGRRRNSQGMMSSDNNNNNEETEDDSDHETTDDLDLQTLHTFRPNTSSTLHRSRRSTSHKDLVFVRFPLPADDKFATGVDEALLRLMLVRHPNHQNHRHHHNHLRGTDNSHHQLQVHVYQLSGPSARILLDTMSVDVADIGERGKWIEFNVRAAVNSWIDEEHTNLGFEIDCRGCDKQGVQVVHEQSNVSADFYPQEDADDLDDDILRPIPGHAEDNSPALNIISRSRSKRSRVLKPYANRLHSRKPHHTKCEEHNGQKCCRSAMVVVFRDLKALDFILQPKTFDAGYCRGKCPFNYNVASNHAYLQGMIWRQDRKKVPRPCCAPKKLEDLQVLHIDEQDPTKLKVSTWTEMRVLECACS